MSRLFSLILLIGSLSVVGRIKAQNIFRDKTSQKIWEAKDRSDLVYTKYILSKGNIQQKSFALKGLLSWNDAGLRKPLLKLLKKGSPDIKNAVLEAIGQSRDSFFIQSLLKIIHHKKTQKIKANALVALGKCITKSNLEHLLSITETDQTGYGECIYRAMLKGVGHKTLTDNMTKLLRAGNSGNRFYAAWYLARTAYPVTSENFSNVIYLLYEEQNISTDISIPLIMSLSKAKVNKDDSLRIRMIFDSYLKNEKKLSPEASYLNLVSTYRSITASKLIKSYSDLTMAENPAEKIIPPLQLAASEMIMKNCKSFSSYRNFTYSPAVVNIIKTDECFSGALKLTPTNTIYDNIWKLQLQEDFYNFYPVIKNTLVQTPDPAIKTLATESLIKCRNSKGFPANLIDDFIETIAILIKDADPGVLSVVANALLDKQITLESDYNPDNLKDLFAEAKSNLLLPRDMEAFIDIEKVLAMFNKTTYQKPEPEWNKPLDWNHIISIPKNQKIKVTTNKGNFIIQMNVEEAPGSVSAILQLVESGYYNDKSFHRMVPNFVIQGGCPRGDGYGGLNYTLRSEFSSLKYSSGAVGLASAGPNTESCQWFVTHCPTPHLDGRYTIIGYVVEGMEVIHRLGVGDKMLQVEKI